MNIVDIKNDKTVDHVKTQFDEASQLEVIVPGQFQVDLEALKTYLQRQSAFKEVKAYVDKLMKEENLGYYLSLGKLGESNYEKTVLQDVASYFGMTTSKLEKHHLK